VIAPACEVRVSELAELIAQAAGLLPSFVENDGLCSSGTPSSLPLSAQPPLVDAVPASSVFGHLALVELPVGLARTFEWFEARLGRRPADRPSGIYPNPNTLTRRVS
jgi:hypothetical protein